MVKHAGSLVSLVAGLVLAGGTAASGQALVHVFNGSNPADLLGWANSGAGDVNLDGYDDVVVGAPFADPNGSSSGLVRVFSGKDGSILHEWHGQQAGGRFGQTVSDAGDVDLDGYPDVIIGINFFDGEAGVDCGAAEVYSGSTGLMIYHWEGVAPGDVFGDAVADAGDVNDDGTPDLVVSSRLNDQNGESSGMARVFSGEDGSVLYTWFGAGGDLFGSGLDGAGDVNADGHDDIIVGARWADLGGTNSGAAYVFSGFDGSVLHTFPGGAPGDGLGNSTAGGGDINKDGRADLLVGAWTTDTNGTDAGSLLVYSGLDGSPLFAVHGDMPADRLGVFVSTAGDVNHDGWVDFMTGAFGMDITASNSGAVRVYSGKDASIFFTVYGDNTGDELGVVVSEAGDVNADGWDDVISGTYWNDVNGMDTGSARVYSGPVTLLPTLGAGLAGTNGVPELIAGGTLVGGSPLTLKLNEALAGTSAHLIVGISALNAPFKGGVMLPAPNFILPGLPTDVHGQFLLDLLTPTGMPSGVPRYFQYWISDPAGAQGFSASNGATATTP
jgi:hypothetical protein